MASKTFDTDVVVKGKVSQTGTPVNPTDLVPKSYADALGGGGGGAVGSGTPLSDMTPTPATTLVGSDRIAGTDMSLLQSIAIELEELRKFLHNPALLDHQATVPTAPPINQMKFYAKKVGGRIVPHWIGPTGVDVASQASFARNGVNIWDANAGANTFTFLGMPTPTATGTATAVTPSNTSIYTLMPKVEARAAAAATTAVAGWRYSVATFLRGTIAGTGGFHFICRWGPGVGTSIATSRAFCGLRNTAAPTDVEPSTLTNMCGMGWDAADANIQFFRNDNTGTATKIDLGATLPVPTVDSTKMYELAMFCAPNGAEIFYEVTDLGTGAVVTGSVTTDLPVASTFIAPNMYMSVGGTSGIPGIALTSMYIETDL